jgi:hypothetical protein
VKRAKAFAPISIAFTGAFSTPPEALTCAPTYFMVLIIIFVWKPNSIY